MQYSWFNANFYISHRNNSDKIESIKKSRPLKWPGPSNKTKNQLYRKLQKATIQIILFF
jgi:hypothetical protein